MMIDQTCPNYENNFEAQLRLWEEQNLLSGSTNLNFLIFPNCNILLMRKNIFNIKLLYKHADNCVQLQT
jgi:hypothetical protein